MGVVIPAYNRKPNLLLVLEALSRQTSDDFLVAVADDGSDDGTREAVEELCSRAEWRGRLRWLDCGPHQGERRARARNLGAAALAPDCELLVVLDSDVLLAENGIRLYGDVSRRYPGAMVIGITDWLPPLSLDRIREIIRQSGLDGLRREVPPAPPRKIHGTYVGPELRLRTHPELFSSGAETRCPLQPGWALTLSSGYPVELFQRLGGFDESMTGYGYEDIELGVRASLARTDCVICPRNWSLHVWHAKPHPEFTQLEIQRNLDYMLRKHGPLEAFAERINWSCWWHYHRERGGRVVRMDGDLWVVNTSGSHKLRLSGPEWISRLGFSVGHDATSAPDAVRALDMGPAALTLLD